MLVEYIKDGTLVEIEDVLANELLKAKVVRRAKRWTPPSDSDGPVLGDVVDPDQAVYRFDNPPRDGS